MKRSTIFSYRAVSASVKIGKLGASGWRWRSVLLGEVCERISAKAMLVIVDMIASHPLVRAARLLYDSTLTRRLPIRNRFLFGQRFGVAGQSLDGAHVVNLRKYALDHLSVQRHIAKFDAECPEID